MVKKENKKKWYYRLLKCTENKLKIHGFLKKPSNLLVLKEEKLYQNEGAMMIGKISDVYKFEP